LFDEGVVCEGEALLVHLQIKCVCVCVCVCVFWC
jgi:hypothetical protein